MKRPNKYVANAGYATLKNDDKKSVSLAITSASPVLNYGEDYTYSNTVAVGTVNAAIRSQIYSSVDTSKIYSSPQIQIILRATIAGGVYNYPATVYIERISATTVEIKCHIYGYALGTTVQITGGFQTITANIVTFLSPFN